MLLERKTVFHAPDMNRNVDAFVTVFECIISDAYRDAYCRTIDSIIN